MAIEKGFSKISEEGLGGGGGRLFEGGSFFETMAFGCVLISGSALNRAWMLIQGNTVRYLLNVKV